MHEGSGHAASLVRLCGTISCNTSMRGVSSMCLEGTWVVAPFLAYPKPTVA